MDRTTKTINLVLIGSALLVSGCGSNVTAPDDTRRGGGSSISGSRGYYHTRGGRTVFVPSGSPGAGNKGGSMSPRGGFGSSGHAVAGG